jgi:hypothetical protein
VFDQLHLEILDRLGLAGRLDWSRANVDSASVRAKRGDHVGANPVDRGKPGSKLHLVCNGGGLPLTAAVTAANVNDGLLFAALLDHVPAVLTRPGKVDADRATPAPPTAPRCAVVAPRHGLRRGVESSGRLGRHRWRIERTLSWLSCYRRWGGWDRTRRVVRVPAADLRAGVLQAAVANACCSWFPQAALLLHHRL